jgi:hypothetical protein
MCGQGGSKAGIKGEGLVIFDFEYSPTHFSKKFVFPWRLIISIHSNGLPIF